MTQIYRKKGNYGGKWLLQRKSVQVAERSDWGVDRPVMPSLLRIADDSSRWAAMIAEASFRNTPTMLGHHWTLVSSVCWRLGCILEICSMLSFLDSTRTNSTFMFFNDNINKKPKWKSFHVLWWDRKKEESFNRFDLENRESWVRWSWNQSVVLLTVWQLQKVIPGKIQLRLESSGFIC